MAPAGFDANAEVIRGLQGSGFNVGDHYQVTGDGEGGFVVSIHVRDGVPIGTPDQRHADHERTGKQQLGADSVLFIHVYHLDPGWHVTSTVDDMERRESDPSGSKSADGPDLGGAVGDLAGKILKNGKLTASQKIREKRDSRRAAEAAAAPAKGAKGWLVLPLVGAAAALLVGAGAGAAAGLVPGTGARAGSTTARVGMVAPVASAIRPVTFEDIDTQLVLEGNIITGTSALDSTAPFTIVAVIGRAGGAAPAGQPRAIDRVGTTQLYLYFDGTTKHKGIRTLAAGRWSMDTAADNLTYVLNASSLSFYWPGLKAGDSVGFVTADGAGCRTQGVPFGSIGGAVL